MSSDMIAQENIRQSVPYRPVTLEPFEGRVETRHCNVGPGPKRGQLGAVSENPIRDRLVPLDTRCGLVGVSGADEIIDVGHAVFLPRPPGKSTVFSPDAWQGKQRYSYRVDKLSVILARIEPLMRERGLNPSTLSLKATDGRSKDLIRNWQRAVKRGEDASARLESVAQVAAALDVSDVWLSSGLGQKEALSEEERILLDSYRAIEPEDRPRHLRAAVETLRLGHRREETLEAASVPRA